MKNTFNFKKYTNETFGVPPDGVVEIVMEYPDSFKKEPVELGKIFPNIRNIKMYDDGTVAIIAFGTVEEIVI